MREFHNAGVPQRERATAAVEIAISATARSSRERDLS
jgi:hypothetical protein